MNDSGSRVEKPVVVEKEKDEWVVRNDGDSAVLFKSGDKEPAVQFAKEMADQHGIRLVVIDEERPEEEPDQQPAKKIIVKENGDKWEVFHEGDTAILFSAGDRQTAVEFANDMAESHGIRVKVIRS